MTSILTTIKKLLGIESDYTHFDSDIIIYINSVLMSLNQIGIGPDAGYAITSDTETWSNYLGASTNLEAVKSYIYLKVRLVFDPPSSDSVIKAIERQIQELEWRLNIQGEEV